MPALPVAVPLLVAAALAATGSFTPRWMVDAAALVTAVAVTVICAVLLVSSTHETITYWFGGWQPRDGVALGISFAIDPTGAGLAAFAGLLTSAALIFSWRHFDEVSHAFHALMLVFLAAMVGFSLSGDIFNMFVFFELMTVAAVALTAYQIDERPPLEGALNFAITNTIGGFLVVSGIGLIYGRTGALNLAQIGTTLSKTPPGRLVVVAFTLLAGGFFVKAAVVPFHFWLADAYAVAPTPVCVLLSGVMSELGLYAVARLYWTAFSVPFGAYEAGLRAVLVGAGIITTLLGATMCFLQYHLKRMLAFATVSSVGFALVGIGLFTSDGLAGTAVYALGDGLIKASLFVSVGILQHRNARLGETRLRSLGRGLPYTAAVFVLGGLAFAGIPPFGSFLGKAMIEEAAHKEGFTWVPALLTLASILLGGAVLRAAGRVFFGWGPEPESDPESWQADLETEPEIEETRDYTPATLFAPALGLLLGGLAVGLVPGLAPAAHEAAARFIDHNAYAAAVLHGLPAVQAPVKPTHVPKESDLLYAIGSTLGALALAVIALFGHRSPHLPRALAALARAGSGRLRALHSGHPGDYVAWITLGVAVFGGLFTLVLR